MALDLGHYTKPDVKIASFICLAFLAAGGEFERSFGYGDVSRLFCQVYPPAAISMIPIWACLPGPYSHRPFFDLALSANHGGGGGGKFIY